MNGSTIMKTIQAAFAQPEMSSRRKTSLRIRTIIQIQIDPAEEDDHRPEHVHERVVGCEHHESASLKRSDTERRGRPGEPGSPGSGDAEPPGPHLRSAAWNPRKASGAPQLALTDARLALAVLNHVRYDALRWAFGVNREQANVVTVLLVLGAAEAVYEGARRIPGLRPSISGTDAAIGAVALRDAALGAVGGPAGRQIPGFATLVAGAALADPRDSQPAQGGRARPRGRAADARGRGADPQRADPALRGRARARRQPPLGAKPAACCLAGG